MTLDERVLMACHRIEELYHETGGKCVVSFSGGKDSTVVLALTRLCIDAYTLPADGIKAVFANTGIELGVTVDFVKWCRDSGWYPNIEIIRPEKPFDWVIKNHGKPMKSKLKAELLHRWQTGKRTPYVLGSIVRGVLPTGTPSPRTKIADKDMHMLHDDFHIIASPKCCEYMKKRPFQSYAKEHGYIGQCIGLRIAEGGARTLSAERRVKDGGKICTYTSHGSLYKAPIIDWTDDDVEEFIKAYNVPLSKAYTEYGFHRTGCMACPFARSVDKDLEYLHDHEPNRYKAAMHWLKDVYIAQNVVLPFDADYERERERTWRDLYEPMRQEMLRKYRPNSPLIKDYQELSLI